MLSPPPTTRFSAGAAAGAPHPAATTRSSLRPFLPSPLLLLVPLLLLHPLRAEEVRSDSEGPSPTGAQCLLHPVEAGALAVLAADMACERWRTNPGWNLGMDVTQAACEAGNRLLECSGCGASGDGFNHVTGIFLDFNQLKGSLPDEIGLFSHLRSLDISTNELYGELPGELGNLTQLEYLDLSYNRFEGQWSRTLLGLTNLRALHIGYNDFIGNLADFLESYPILEILSLKGNRYFQGDLDSPEVRSGLRRISTTIRELDLSWNSIGGGIPKEIGTLKNLEILSLSKNLLSGELPDGQHFESLRFLETLTLQENALSGTVPDSIAKLPRLRVLRLDNNRFSGAIPKGLLTQTGRGEGHASKLEEINLARNFFAQMEDGWLTHHGDCGALRTLDISHNPFEMLQLSPGQASTVDDDSESDSGGLSSSVGPLATFRPCAESLEILRAVNANMSGSIPPSSLVLPRLRVLDLHRNRLAGTIPPIVGSMMNLEALRLDGNYLTGSIPKFISTFALAYLSLHSNRLQGSLPQGLEHLSALQYVSLHNNHLSGELVPEYFGDRSRNELKVLTLHNNIISGTVPESYADAESIEVLTLHDNHIKGNPRPVYDHDSEFCINLNAPGASRRFKEAGVEPVATSSLDGNTNMQTERHHFMFRICGTRNDFFADVLEGAGWVEVDHDGWDAAYGDCAGEKASRWSSAERKRGRRHSYGADQFGAHVLDFQTQSRYPDMYIVLADKSRFGAAIKSASERTGKPGQAYKYGPHPLTFQLPSDREAWERTALSQIGKTNNHSQRYWLLKPAVSCCGRGIRLVQGPKDETLPTSLRGWVAQEFIHPPFLYDNHKFVLRLFTIVTSFRPLKAYHYRDGPVFYTAQQYDIKRALEASMLAVDRAKNSSNDDVHAEHYDEESEAFVGKEWILTDYYFSLKQRDYEVTARKLLESISSLPEVKDILKHHSLVESGGNSKIVDAIWYDIEEAMAKSLIVATDKMAMEEMEHIPHGGSVYEVLGFDILLDSNLKPWVCEVNTTPNMGLEVNKGGDADVEKEDFELKFKIMEAMLAIAGVHPRRVGITVPLNLQDTHLGVPCVGAVLDGLDRIGARLAADGDNCMSEDFECFTEDDIAELIDFECELRAASDFDHISRVFPRWNSDMEDMLDVFDHPSRSDALLAWWLKTR